MKNKKGFTLVELLGVFTLIGIVLLLVVPNVTQMLNRSKKDDYDRFMNDLFLASEAYIESNQQQIENLRLVGGKSYIKVEDMIYAGYLRSTIINPKTNQKIDPNSTIIARRTSSEKVTYEYIEENLTISGYVQDGLRLHHDSFVKPIDGKWTNLGNVGSASTLQNFSSTNGFRGSQVDFDGTNYISYGPLNYNYVSVSAYFYIPEATTSEQDVITNFENGGYGIIYDYANNNKIGAAFFINGTYVRVTDFEDYQLNRWYHVTATYNGSRLSLYIDGELRSVVNVNGTIGAPTGNTYLMMGTNPSGTTATTKFKLSLRSAMVYDRALTDQEIKQNYELDRKRYSTGSENYIKNGLMLQFDGYEQPAGTVWNDLSGNGRNGTLVNISSASYSNYGLTFNGNNSYIDLGNHLIDLYKSSMTMEIVVLFDDDKKRGVLLGNHPTANSIGIEKGYENRAGRIWYKNGVLNYFSPDDFFTTNSIQNYSFQLDKSKATFYFHEKGILKYQIHNSVLSENIDFPNARIGADLRSDIATAALKGKIYAVRIYDRILTEEELKQNYELDHIRFGI